MIVNHDGEDPASSSNDYEKPLVWIDLEMTDTPLEEGVKWLKHYSSMQSILIVGDGDFSFSRALVTAFGSGENLVATSLDAFEDLRRKYNKAESNIMELKRMGATVFHGINAKMMKNHTDLKMRRFDRIVFNFPHAGFKGKEDDLHMINLHKELVWGFFQNARHLLRPYGEIHVSHKIGQPYDSWDIKQLAFESSLIMFGKVDFRKEDYPGYNQKRGDSAKCDQPFDLGACCTFKFCINRIDSFLSRCSEVHPDIMATDMNPFHPPPVVPAWPQPHFPPPVNTIYNHMPVTLEPYLLGVAHRHQPGFPVIFHDIERVPYFDEQGAIRPMFSMPMPSLNVDGIPPPMSRITRTSLLAPPEQPWYQERPIAEPVGRGEYSYFVREYQRSPLREYGMQRQVMPGRTRAPQEQPWYEERLNVEPEGRGDYSYFTRDYQRSLQGEYEMERQVIPGGTHVPQEQPWYQCWYQC